jgi:hypothetical protein
MPVVTLCRVDAAPAVAGHTGACVTIQDWMVHDTIQSSLFEYVCVGVLVWKCEVCGAARKHRMRLSLLCYTCCFIQLGCVEARHC